MDFLTDPAVLSRFQFALTVAFHFIFVPLSIGLGLILAINETRYYKTRDPKDAAATRFWVKVFTTTFVIGVATGITMEFSFGTNWANYSRFVGDIFGAPLAAEALFAFFLESSFLGIVLLGRKKVSPKFYLVSTWLVFGGSCLSALWILIANSWMQTPAGAELSADGSKAVLTDFFSAAFNASTGVRYFHTVLALLVMGAFVAMAVAAWYRHKGTHPEFAERTLRLGAVVGVVATCCLLVSAHATAVEVTNEQPSKIAMMEGHYETGTLPLYAIGYVDEESQEVVAPFAIEGGTSMLASNDFSTEYPGLNDLAEEDSNLDVDSLPVGFVFTTYHTMVAMFGVICLILLLALIASFKKNSKLFNNKFVQWLFILGPLAPFIAIQTGWATAEVGRQPYVVYPATSSPDGISLLTDDAISMSVSSTELLITIALFIIVYIFLFVAWARVVGRIIKEGPVEEPEDSESKLAKAFAPSKKGGKKTSEAKDAKGSETKDSQAKGTKGSEAKDAVATDASADKKEAK
jgi:cytochrome d ubiquinol oxidase subunit I